MKVIVEVFLTRDKMPVNCSTVMVHGGLAWFSNGQWYTAGADYGKPLQWKPQWWAEVLRNSEIADQMAIEDLAALGGIVDAP